MSRLKVIAVLAAAIILSGILTATQSSTPTTKSRKPSSTSASKKSAATKKTATRAGAKSRSKTTAKSRRKVKRVRVSPAKLRRMKKAFVASAELKPMALQLLDTRSKPAYAGVEAYARKHPGTDEAAMAWLAVGYAHLLDKEYPQAQDALKKAQPHAGELDDYVLFMLAQSYAGQGNWALVATALHNFRKDSPESIFNHDVVDIYGNALVATNRAEEAIRYLEENREPTRADVELALGRAYVKAGQAAKGGEILRHLYITMPSSPEADAAANDLQTLQASGVLPPAVYGERKQRAALLVQANRFSDAANEYRALLNDAPQDEKPAIQVALGAALRRSGNNRDAADLLQSVQVTGEANAIRLYNLGEIARDKNDDAAFIDNLNRMRQEVPTSGWFATALLSAGNMYLLEKDYDKAIDSYRELCTRFPNDPRASYTHWKAAWLDYRQGRLDQAKQEFTDQIRQWPKDDQVAAALYWRGRIAEAENDRTTAVAFYAKVSDRFRNYYYGYLGRDRLKQLGPLETVSTSTLLEAIPRPKPLPEEAQETEVPAGDLHVEKSKLLENAGLTDYAVKELQEADGGKSANWATLQIGRIYRDAGKYYRSLQILKRAVPSYYSLDLSALPREYWLHLFPRPFWSDLQNYSGQNGLNPDLVASLIRQESEFNPSAISYANAWGLMQLLPKVGKGEAHELKMRFSQDQLLSPTVNLRLGTRYLKEMIDHYNGQVEYALAAYNAGTNRVDDWLASGKFQDVPEFVESIPFTQTREYVQAIMRNAQVYRQLYAGQKPERGE
ncbi:MAG TPA: transglycosylase SLT domain-containing protein [Terriglobales bacterium]|nr:transglycosylase SLT domain-containing protein [Terriglobales bacterium]